MHDKIRAALASLDPARDEHWTTSGLPAMGAVCSALGATVTRAQVEAAAPGFTRAAVAAAVTDASEAAPAAPPPGPDPEADPLDDQDHAALARSTAPDHVARYEPPAELDLARLRVAELRAERSDLVRRIELAKGDLAELDQVIDEAEGEVARLCPPVSDAEAIRQVSDRADEERRKRVEAARANGADPRSPLDRAIAAKNRGRPTYPLLRT